MTRPAEDETTADRRSLIRPIAARAEGEPLRPRGSEHVRRLLRERYRGELPSALSEAAVASPVLETLLGHRSVRRYLPAPLPQGTLELLVAAAQSAATSSNLQLWSVVSVEDAALRSELATLANNQEHVRQAPAFLVWIADLHRATAVARDLGLDPAGLDYLEMFLMASIDAALAAQAAVVAAEGLGLGTVYIGALRNHPERVAQALALPQRAFAVFGLCIGYPDPVAAGAVKPRLGQSVVLHRDRYGEPANRRPAVEEYDRIMTEFYREQRMEVPAGGWSLHSARRVATPAALHGRDRLREALAALGFELR